MILNAIADKRPGQSKAGFKGRHFEAWLIVRAVAWYLRSVVPVLYSHNVSSGTEACELMSQ